MLIMNKKSILYNVISLNLQLHAKKTAYVLEFNFQLIKRNVDTLHAS